MFLFVIAILFVISGILSAVFAGVAQAPGGKRGMRIGGIAAVVFGFLLFAVSGLKTVPVKNIGVPQSFGAVHSGFYSPGVHETWTPWLHLTDVNETVQTTTFEGPLTVSARTPDSASRRDIVTL